MNRSRAKGTSWESAIVKFLNEWWPHVERRTLSGTGDRGDIAGLPGLIIEAKNTTEYRLGEWVNEANREAGNANADLGVVWAHRKGKASPGDGYVIMDGHRFAKLLRDAGW